MELAAEVARSIGRGLGSVQSGGGVNSCQSSARLFAESAAVDWLSRRPSLRGAGIACYF